MSDPIIRGGQGRPASSVQQSAEILAWCLALAALLLALCWLCN
jgi:hypothetical protein